MGRRRTKYCNLPKGLRARRQRSGKLYYYYDHGGRPRRETPLGGDYVVAIRRWAELELDGTAKKPALTFRDVAERYLNSHWYLDKAPRTQQDNLKELENLYEFFDDPPAPLEGIEPQHVRAYLNHRTKGGRVSRVRANREKALMSHIWNFARDHGHTALANPCAGIKGFEETGRDIYVEQEVLDAVWELADQPLRDAMDLAYLTGQRPSDVLGLNEGNIRDGLVHLTQRKTGHKLRIEVVGELAELLVRLRARRANLAAGSSALIFSERGRPLSRAALWKRFDKAREAAANKYPALKAEIEAFQFRDLRAKAGTDKADSAADPRAAQRLLSHASLTQTEHYTRKRKGAKVTPTR